jgi:hypothetical protein
LSGQNIQTDVFTEIYIPRLALSSAYPRPLHDR